MIHFDIDIELRIAAENNVVVGNSSVLDINVTSFERGGVYVCAAAFIEEDIPIGFSTLFIQPYFTTGDMQDITIGYNSKVILSCKAARGFPNIITVSWLRLIDEELTAVDPEIVEEDRVVIDKATFNDSGVYFCQADNAVGTALKEFNLTGQSSVVTINF